MFDYQEAEVMQNRGISMLAVGITNVIDAAFLEKMSSQPRIEGQQYFKSPNFIELPKILRSLTKTSCDSALVLGMTYFL